MKHYQKLIIIALILLLAGSIAVPAVFAEETPFTIARSVIGSGGLGASGGDVSISSTFGQTITGSVNNGTVTVWSGFWTAFSELLNKIFLPLILQ